MKVIKVKFKQNEEVHYFTSYAAIFSWFTRIDIGAVIGTVWNKVSKEGKFENSKVEITPYPLLSRKKTKL